MGDELEDDPDSFRTLESLDQTLTCLSVRMQQSTTIFAAVVSIHGEPRPLVLACAHPCVRVSAHVSFIVSRIVSLIVRIHACAYPCTYPSLYPALYP